MLCFLWPLRVEMFAQSSDLKCLSNSCARVGKGCGAWGPGFEKLFLAVDKGIDVVWS